jgi:hypothetical protein
MLSSGMPSHRLPRDSAPYIRLKEIIAARGLSVTDLALALGLSRAAVYRSLSKNSGLEHYWVPIARWLNISLDWLLAGKLGSAPVELIDMTAAAALSDTETITSGRIIGLVDQAPTEHWPIKKVESYVAARGRWGLRLTEAIPPMLNAGDVLVLDAPFDEHLGDSRSIVQDGDFVAVQGEDGTVTIGRVQKESKRGWYVITSLAAGGKTTVWTESDIHQMHCITGIEIRPRIESQETVDERANVQPDSK